MDIISNREYEELLRQQLKKSYRTIKSIMIFLSVLELLIALILTLTLDEDIMATTIFLYISAAAFLILAGVFHTVSNKIDTKDSPHFSYDYFVDYQTEGTKVPLTRIISYGKNSETVYVILDVLSDGIKLFDIRRKQLKPYKQWNKSEIEFYFYFKQKHGLEAIKPKIDIVESGRKTRVYGYKEINERLLDFLREQGYQIEIK